MKHFILFFCIAFFYTNAIQAQFNKESREKIKTLKIAYLTEQLELTPKEAEQFWPIYNVYDEKQLQLRFASRNAMKKALKGAENSDNITEKEAEELIALKLKNDKELYEVQKEFVDKAKKIISNKKIVKLQVAEMEFARKLMRKYKKKG